MPSGDDEKVAERGMQGIERISRQPQSCKRSENGAAPLLRANHDRSEDAAECEFAQFAKRCAMREKCEKNPGRQGQRSNGDRAPRNGRMEEDRSQPPVGEEAPNARVLPP